MSRTQLILLCAGSLVAPFSLPVALAQSQDLAPDIAPLPSVTLPWNEHYGDLRHLGPVEESRVVASTIVHVPGAAWLRVVLDGTQLGGDPAAEGAIIRLTSMLDGATQILSGESIEWSSGHSAFFNGDAVQIEVVAHGGQPSSSLAISSVIAGEQADIWGERTICGTIDDRTLSDDERQGRLSSGCTGWLISDLNGSFLTAGHCGGSATSTVSFNVPLSTASGSRVASLPQDQYSFDAPSIQFQNGGVGNDWQYFATLPNTTTGWTARQVQGAAYTLANAPSSAGQIRITGYGSVSAPVSPTWNFVQKTHVGNALALSGTTVRYTTDTTGGNSGSPVVQESTGLAIGIHTHGGCTSSGGNNNGTARQNAGLTAALNSPRGVATSGSIANTSSLYVIGDLANNFGTCDTASGGFGKRAQVGRRHQGLAYNQFTDRFYMINSLFELYELHPVSGAATLLGSVTGTTLTFTGLAFDPFTSTLYGCTSSGGRLWRINVSTRVATPIGATTSNVLSGLEFDASSRRLLGLADNASGTVLLSINPATGVQTQLGNLGAGITDCNGLAVDPASGAVYTINAATDQLLRLNPLTGAATVVGPTGGAFGANYGMAWRGSVQICESDINNDLSVDGDDVIAFFLAWDAGRIEADFTRDESVDGDDVIAFFARWDAGC